MAKRFIDTDIFKKQFIRSLPGVYKLLWLYILNDCNHAGIWEVDFEVAAIRLGISIEESVARGLFNEKIVEIDQGKWFIPSFIEFQYGELRDNNKAHQSIISIISRYNLSSYIRIGYNDPVNSSIKGEKRKDLFLIFDHTCVYCGNVFKENELQPDHVIPLKKGGTNKKENVVCSCIKCNLKKSDFDLYFFIKRENLDKKRILKTFALRGIQAPNEAPIQGAKDKEMDMDKEKDKEMDMEKEGGVGDFQYADLWPSFEDFWNVYDKKVDRVVCEKKWKALKQEDKESIMAYLPRYVSTTPDKKYRKDPETFLNRRSWENELILDSPGVSLGIIGERASQNARMKELNEKYYGNEPVI